MSKSNDEFLKIGKINLAFGSIKNENENKSYAKFLRFDEVWNRGLGNIKISDGEF